MPVAILGLLGFAGYQGVIFWLTGWAILVVRRQSRMRRGRPLPMALCAPIALVTFEMVTPVIFPFYVAITQAWITPIIQIAELTGPVGVSALLLAFNGAVYDALTTRDSRRRWLPLVAASGLVAAALLYGVVRMSQVDAARGDAPTLEVGLLQGNIPFDAKGKPELAPQQMRSLQRKSAELEASGAELIVWPETTLPYWLPRDFAADFPAGAGNRIREGFSVPLILGTVTRDTAHPDKLPYNSALMIDRAGNVVGRFDKIFLLLFGEYTPLADRVEWIRDLVPKNAGHFSRGDAVTTFPLEHKGATYRLGPMICYEDILSGIGRQIGALHPHLLVNLTNDAWFGETSEPWEHLALSVYRSVELRVDLVRAVNTGVSAAIDASGRVIAKTYAVDPHKKAVQMDGLHTSVRLLEGGHGFYARYGDLFGYLCVLITATACLAWPWWTRRVRLERTRVTEPN
jgi:apolipoprotein N-acyltransferase